MATNPAGLIAQLLSPQGVNSFQDGVQQGQQQRQNQQALQIGAMQIAAAKQQQQQQAQYATDIQSYFDRGARVDDLAHLAAKYPQQAAALQKSYDLMDSAQKQSRLTQYGNLWNAASNGRTELLINQLTALQKAEQAIPGTDTSDLDDALRGLQSSDPDQVAKATTFVKGIAQIHLAQDPDAAKTIGIGNASRNASHVIGNYLVDDNGKVLFNAPETKTVKNADGSESVVQLGGGDPTSSGDAPSSGAGASGRDTSRLINSDAGGGYVPASVQTLGQFVNFGKALNAKGAKSSSAGTYQINGSTMMQFAPQALGPDWKSAPFNAASQEKVGEAIFNWAKQQSNPAAALKSRWVSLSGPQAAQLVQGDWQQARSTIAQGETGGAPGSSANVGTGPNSKVLFTSKGNDPSDDMSDEELGYWAQSVAGGGQLPPLGMGKEAAGLRRQILKKAADINIAKGIDGLGQNLLHADLKANTGSLGALTKLQSMVSASEQTASANADQVLRLAPQGVGGSVPIFNRWIQGGRKQVSGDPAVARFDVAVKTFANEYAKVMTTNTGTGGVTSDSARHEAESLINRNMTLPQLQQTVAQMKIDMHNRQIALEGQRQYLSGNISGGQALLPSSKPPAQSGVPTRTATNPKTGQRLGLINGQWVPLK